MNAAFLGSQMAEHRISAAKAAVRRKTKEEEASKQDSSPTVEVIQQNHYLLDGPVFRSGHPGVHPSTNE
jgi:hypothetical protein